ncbi:MAG TPA: ester cyclase [Candidatus Nanopelagicales bacterium]|nr:ester cyclase [Candidatus Nanopelagicales bacterium]
MSNKELVRRFFEDLLNREDLDCAREIATASYIEHAVAPFGREAPGVVDGPEHLANVSRSLKAQFPDLRTVIEAMVEEGDMVAVRVRAEGTNDGAINAAVPATGRRFSSWQSHWFRIEDGRLAEHWANREDLPTMLQLGLVSPPGARPSA